MIGLRRDAKYNYVLELNASLFLDSPEGELETRRVRWGIQSRRNQMSLFDHAGKLST